MKLRDLLGHDTSLGPRADAVEVQGLAVDSRVVRPGDLFFALAGTKTDGGRFIQAAIAAGAVAVAGEQASSGDLPVPFVTLSNPRRALALAAARFFPLQPATIAAVTGTSGKTSVAAFTRQIWQRLGHCSASIGTIGLVSDKRTIYGSLTTPDPIALHRQIDEITRDGVTHLAFEASSHGSTSIASTACVSPPVASPIFRATTWIIILMSRITSLPRCGCSAIWCHRAALP